MRLTKPQIDLLIKGLGDLTKEGKSQKGSKNSMSEADSDVDMTSGDTSNSLAFFSAIKQMNMTPKAKKKLEQIISKKKSGKL